MVFGLHDAISASNGSQEEREEGAVLLSLAAAAAYAALAEARQMDDVTKVHQG